jgi:aspartyl protease family protein
MRHDSGRRIDLTHICTGNSPQQNGTATTATNYSLPIKRREGGTPVVEVTFNNKQRFEMLFDTGATGTVITPAMAKALNVKEEGQVTAHTAGGKVSNSVGRVASAQAGSIVVNNLEVLINPHIPMGLLGQNFYGNRDVTIKEKVIELKPRRN